MKVPLATSGGGVFSDDCTATLAQVLSPYTAVTSDSDDEAGTGTMADNGAVSQTLSAGSSYTIPQGYHNGSGKVTATALSSQTSATASAADILSGKTAWVDGSKLTGTMTNNGTVTKSVSAGSSYTIAKGYHSGSGKVSAATTSSSPQFAVLYAHSGKSYNSTSTSTGTDSFTIPSGAYNIKCYYHWLYGKAGGKGTVTFKVTNGTSTVKSSSYEFSGSNTASNNTADVSTSGTFTGTAGNTITLTVTTVPSSWGYTWGAIGSVGCVIIEYNV